MQEWKIDALVAVLCAIVAIANFIAGYFVLAITNATAAIGWALAARAEKRTPLN